MSSSIETQRIESSGANTPAAAMPQRERLPVKLKAGWAIGAAGSVTMMIIVNIMLLYFMVSILGIPPASAGFILAVVRVLDMFLDPMMGILSDRTRSRWGRRRPWLLIGGILSAISTVTLFVAPALAPPEALTVTTGLMLVFFYASYSMFSVPYLAIPSEMTDDYDERTSIMSYRTAASGIAGLVSVSGAPFLVSYFGNDASAYAMMSMIIGTFILGTMLTSFFATASARQSVPTARQGIRSLAVLARPDFSILIGVKFLALSAISCNAALQFFFQVHITQRGAAGVALLGAAQHVTTLAMIPLLLWSTKFVEKRAVLMASLLIYALASLSWLASHPGESDVLFTIRGGALGIGYAGIVLMTLAMLPDTIQADFVASGVRREGIMAGIFAGIEKTAWAVAPLVAGLTLSSFGFVGSRDASVVQTPEALRGIELGAAILPALACALPIPLLFAYGLTRSRLQQMKKEVRV